MGARAEFLKGRRVVALAAMLFYAFVSSWVPLNLPAAVDAPQHHAYVVGLDDDTGDELLAGLDDLASVAVAQQAHPDLTREHRASGEPARKGHAQLIARARDPPNPNV